MTEEFPVGTQVTLRKDVLKRHSLSIPAHVGYRKTDFEWRETLKRLSEHIGIVTMTFQNSKHRNVQFGDLLIGIDYTELVKIE